LQTPRGGRGNPSAFFAGRERPSVIVGTGKNKKMASRRESEKKGCWGERRKKKKGGGGKGGRWGEGEEREKANKREIEEEMKKEWKKRIGQVERG